MYQTSGSPGQDDRVSYWPRGKVLGGSSSINAMVYVRGFPSDFDTWAVLGNPGWGWKDVLPYYLDIEDHEVGAGPELGTGGPLHVHDISSEAHPLCQLYLKAGEELGFPIRSTLNGADPEGVGLYHITVRKGTRESASTAFLRPAMRRNNLTVRTHAQTTRVLFHGRSAVGVEYAQGGTLHSVRASREVILCAGAVNSPQLLQLSGIGPGELLRRHGIPLLLDAPIGRNLQDHLGVDYLFRANKPTLNNKLYPWWGKLRSGMQYVLGRHGPLALSVNQGGGFIRSHPDVAQPDLQMYFSPLSYTRAPTGKRPLMNPDPFPGFLLGYSLCRPSSRGRVEISSPDPLAPPNIYPDYLSTDDDIQGMLAGVHMLRKFASTRSLSSIIEEEIRPGAAITSEEQLLTDIRTRSTTIFHACGTCAMGPDASRFVVDHKLRVHGVNGLRVIDASVFPLLPSGNTNAPAMLVGAKGADLVLESAP
jgi:choline dehydrogenase